MKVNKNTVVSFVYTLSDLFGNIVENGTAPVKYLHGGYGDIMPKIEEALEGAAVGSKVELHLESEDAFGDYDANLVKLEKLANLPSNAHVGMEIEAVEGDDTSVFTITDIAEEQAVLDGNHPFAGLAMRLQAGVVDIRLATPEELENKQAFDEESENSALKQAQESTHYRSYRLN